MLCVAVACLANSCWVQPALVQQVDSLEAADKKIDELAASGKLDPALLLMMAKAYAGAKETDITKEEVGAGSCRVEKQYQARRWVDCDPAGAAAFCLWLVASLLTPLPWLVATLLARCLWWIAATTSPRHACRKQTACCHLCPLYCRSRT